MKKQIRAFTLIEVLTVIVIVVILATIAFLSFKDYPKDARDTVRKTDLKNIEKALILKRTQDWKFLTPDNAVESTTKSWWLEGEFGAELYQKVGKISKLPKDPTQKNYYSYQLNPKTDQYKLIAHLENGKDFILTNAPDTKKWTLDIVPIDWLCNFSGKYNFSWNCIIR